MRTTVIVIGAGHTGLAVSYFLTRRGIDHIILERGDVGHSWRTERWDSLRLLTPNWLSRLPGAPYTGPDPDGYLTMPEVVDFLAAYAGRIEAPVRTGVRVTSVRREGENYRVDTTSGPFEAAAVVIATGACNTPKVPDVAAALPDDLLQLTPHRYRNPGQVPDGGVLVVGAAATGAQIAGELQDAGRQVTLTVGEHVRMPRTYRGHDVLWWMDATGVWDETSDQIDDLVRARHLPSPQLVGSPDRATLDLNSLTARGVRLTGRLAGVRDGVAQFSGSLKNVVTLADLKLHRLLGTFDDWAAEHGLDDDHGAAERPRPTVVPDKPVLTVDLAGEAIRTVVWATGYVADHSWLDIPVLDRKGRLRHDGGVVTASPGLYRIGLPVLRRRKSTFIHGAGDDAREIVDHLAGYLGAAAADSAAPADTSSPAVAVA